MCFLGRHRLLREQAVRWCDVQQSLEGTLIFSIVANRLVTSRSRSLKKSDAYDFDASRRVCWKMHLGHV